MVIVELFNSDIENCVRVAQARMDTGKRLGLNHAVLMQRSDEERLFHEFSGVASELAVAKFLGVDGFIPSSDYIKGTPDVEPDIEVRSTQHARGHLIIRPRDDWFRRYVLAKTGYMNGIYRVCLMGWMFGHEAREERFRDERYRANEFWVPIEELRRMETLRSETDGTV